MRWQFVLGSGVSSRLVAWYGQGYGGWSHVDAILSDGTCLGARSDTIRHDGMTYPPGVQIRAAGYEAWVRRSVIEIRCPQPNEVIWEDFLRSQVGCQYDKADILGFVLGRELKTDGEWICSALQLAGLEHAGILHKLHVTPQQCPPNMLFTVLDTLGGTIS